MLYTENIFKQALNNALVIEMLLNLIKKLD